MPKDDINEWLEERSQKLMHDLATVPFTDDHDYRKLRLIRAAMKEASMQMFKRAIGNSQKDFGKFSEAKILDDDI